jgi:hypothetical protein
MSKMYSKYTRDNVRMRIQNEKRRDDGILGFYRPMSELRHKVTSPHGIFNKVSAARVEHEAFFGPAQLNFFFFFFGSPIESAWNYALGFGSISPEMLHLRVDIIH